MFQEENASDGMPSAAFFGGKRGTKTQISGHFLKNDHLNNAKMCRGCDMKTD